MSNDMKLIMESWRINTINEQQENLIVEKNKVDVDYKKMYKQDNKAYSKALAEEEKNETRSYV